MRLLYCKNLTINLVLALIYLAACYLTGAIGLGQDVVMGMQEKSKSSKAAKVLHTMEFDGNTANNLNGEVIGQGLAVVVPGMIVPEKGGEESVKNRSSSTEATPMTNNFTNGNSAGAETNGKSTTNGNSTSNVIRSTKVLGQAVIELPGYLGKKSSATRTVHRLQKQQLVQALEWSYFERRISFAKIAVLILEDLPMLGLNMAILLSYANEASDALIVISLVLNGVMLGLKGRLIPRFLLLQRFDNIVESHIALLDVGDGRGGYVSVAGKETERRSDLG